MKIITSMMLISSTLIMFFYNIIEGGKLVSDNFSPFLVTSGAAISSAAPTGTPDSTSVPAPSNTQSGKNVKKRIITDPSGKKQELTVGEITEKRKGDYLDFFNYATEYAQVADGHYYYMRKVGKKKYTIYRDKGKVVGTFRIGEDRLYGCLKYAGRFYVLLNSNGTNEALEQSLGLINFQKGDVEILCTLRGNNTNLQFYHKKIFHFLDSSEEEDIDVMDLEGNLIESKMEPRHYRGGFGLGANQYYEKKEGDEIEFYCWNLEYGKPGDERKVFSYKPVPDTSLGEFYGASMEEDGKGGKDIFILEDYSKGFVLYVIRSGAKKMQRVDKGGIKRYIFHKMYVFYTDRKHRIHRWDRKSGEDRIISTIEAMELHCTDKGLYVNAYNKWLADPDDESFGEDETTAIYYMDLDGKNVKKIAE